MSYLNIEFSSRTAICCSRTFLEQILELSSRIVIEQQMAVLEHGSRTSFIKFLNNSRTLVQEPKYMECHMLFKYYSRTIQYSSRISRSLSWMFSNILLQNFLNQILEPCSRTYFSRISGTKFLNISRIVQEPKYMGVPYAVQLLF